MVKTLTGQGGGNKHNFNWKGKTSKERARRWPPHPPPARSLAESLPFPAVPGEAPGSSGTQSKEEAAQGADLGSCLYARRCQCASEAFVPDQGLRCPTEDGSDVRARFYGGLQSVPRWERGRWGAMLS